MSGAVVWITGLPASGKSMLAARLLARLRELGRCVAVLDGDDVRAALDPAPGYDPAARDAFYRTLARLAATLARQGHVVLVPATAPRRSQRAAARAAAPRFLEVHVATSLAECERRDPKGLYRRARRGEAPDLPGLGAAYEPPLAADVVASGGEDEQAVAATLALLGDRARQAP
jgi:adenylylsulfate kinase